MLHPTTGIASYTSPGYARLVGWYLAATGHIWGYQSSVAGLWAIPLDTIFEAVPFWGRLSAWGRSPSCRRRRRRQPPPPKERPTNYFSPTSDFSMAILIFFTLLTSADSTRNKTLPTRISSPRFGIRPNRSLTIPPKLSLSNSK